MAFVESEGLATKKSRSGIVRPAVRPLAQVTPLVPVLRGGHADLVLAPLVDEQVRLLAADRRRVESRVRRVREAGFGRRPFDAREDLVPDAVRPLHDLAVADQPLLLRAVDDEREVRVGDEAAARELRARRAVVHQREVGAGHLEPAHRHGLRDGPEVRRGAAAVLPERVDVQRQVGERAPEVDERDAVARAAVAQAAVVDLDLAVDRHVGRRSTQAGDLGVVAHLHLQRLGGSAIDARLEQERVAVRAHLCVDLLGVDGVDGRLDLTDRHARVEDGHVRAEGRRCGDRGGSTDGRARQEQRKTENRRSNAHHGTSPPSPSSSENLPQPGRARQAGGPREIVRNLHQFLHY